MRLNGLEQPKYLCREKKANKLVKIVALTKS